eukprot:gnl/MRDRNA2_/MRDRNA2_109708_c0_seq1.p1 gnl/MRDRNA2_/MRDRNA2_109708_c0~~gnl/MRDRNA2_/MRDRNA2_109708_c0_seq1.p1  ORF type:complete len:265 (-),score=64.02 gnl/MRDRNA2_/MRDRNA2_109708_c0_seq1:259-1053(-)
MSSSSEDTAGAKIRQLTQRVANLEADVGRVTARKQELELQNEELATRIGMPTQPSLDREAELERQLADAHAEIRGLQAEKKRMDLQSEARDKQQADIASAFAELQHVVAQLVRRLSILDNEQSKLSEEKCAVERAAANFNSAKLRAGVRHSSSSGCPTCSLRCRAALVPITTRGTACRTESKDEERQKRAKAQERLQEAASREEVLLKRAALNITEQTGHHKTLHYCRPRDSVSLSPGLFAKLRSNGSTTVKDQSMSGTHECSA